jgi:ElaB/YqjD/DUF883 family membrane-anchored ribosome-binding protein
MFLKTTTDQATHLADQAAQSADDAIKSTQRATNEALDRLTATVQDMRHQAVPMLDRASEQVSAFAQRGVDSVRETSQNLRERAHRATETTSNYVKDEPVKSLLIAAATGAALMALASLISGSRDRR